MRMCIIALWVFWVGDQYGSEAEMAFPPFAGLEANGEPRLEHINKGELVIFPLKVRLSRNRTLQPTILCATAAIGPKAAWCWKSDERMGLGRFR